MMFARFRAARARDKKLKEEALADAYEKGYTKGKAENGDDGNESPKSPKKSSK